MSAGCPLPAAPRGRALAAIGAAAPRLTLTSRGGAIARHRRGRVQGDVLDVPNFNLMAVWMQPGMTVIADGWLVLSIRDQPIRLVSPTGVVRELPRPDGLVTVARGPSAMGCELLQALSCYG